MPARLLVVDAPAVVQGGAQAGHADRPFMAAADIHYPGLRGQREFTEALQPGLGGNWHESYSPVVTPTAVVDEWLGYRFPVDTFSCAPASIFQNVCNAVCRQHPITPLQQSLGIGLFQTLPVMLSQRTKFAFELTQ